VTLVNQLNRDISIHGILVQLPLPSHINERDITEAVDPKKDVDGFHSENAGKLAKRKTDPLFIPCTPKGVMALLAHAGVHLSGLHAVVLGRSNIVVRWQQTMTVGVTCGKFASGCGCDSNFMSFQNTKFTFHHLYS
jgi:5,10-methylene-tetrahydrofolate dehydrogenase/methenyl tetrahydrofolate cyclohydrolase